MTAWFIGDVALDEYYSAVRWPNLGGKVTITPMRRHVGGMIANAAVVHAGFGAPTEFVSLLNRSAASAELCDALAARGVGVGHMLHDEQMPDSRTIVVLANGEHAVLIPELGNAPMMLPPATLMALQRAEVVYTTVARTRRLGGDGLDAVGILASLHRAGCRLVFDLDVDGVAEADVEVLEGASVVLMNRVGFAATFAGWKEEEVCDWVRAHRIGMLVETRAAVGCVVHRPEGSVAVPGIAVPVVDVTGAGDTFGGALVYAMMRASDPMSAVRFANAAAARAVTFEGPHGGVATASEVLAFIAKNEET